MLNNEMYSNHYRTEDCLKKKSIQGVVPLIWPADIRRAVNVLGVRFSVSCETKENIDSVVFQYGK